MRNVLISAAIAAATFAMPASAATIMSTSGAGAFAAPAGDYTIDFNSAVTAPFTVTLNNAATDAQGDAPGFFSQPAFSDGSKYAAVFGGGSLTLSSQLALNSVSFYAGSIDAGNAVELLSNTGAVIASFNSAQFMADAGGDMGALRINRRVTIKSDVAFAGVRFTSEQNSFEFDNVVFAVPEASTWALMLVGFGLVGAATRYRRRKSVVAFS